MIISFICTTGLAACLEFSGQICQNVELSSKYRGKHFVFSSMHRTNKEGTKYRVYCEEYGTVGYPMENE